jgi:DNA-binding beta-propeller fold protein YncE
LSGTVLSLALKSPSAAAVDNQGGLYVADSGNSRVLEIAAQGVAGTVTTGLGNPPESRADGARTFLMQGSIAPEGMSAAEPG